MFPQVRGSFGGDVHLVKANFCLGLGTIHGKTDTHRGLHPWLDFYNNRRPHGQLWRRVTHQPLTQPGLPAAATIREATSGWAMSEWAPANGSLDVSLIILVESTR